VVLKSRNKSDLITGCEVVGGSRKENGVRFEDFFAPTPYTPANSLPLCVSDIYEKLGRHSFISRFIPISPNFIILPKFMNTFF